MIKPEPRVKKHLEKNNVKPEMLPDEVIAALNACSESELKALDSVGASLQAAPIDPDTKIAAVH